METVTGKNEIRKRILKMLFPIVAESIVQMSSSIISMAIIGRVSVLAIGAIGLSSRITQLVWALFKGITTGTNVFVAQFYGAQNPDKIRKVIVETFISAMILIVLMQILILIFGQNFLNLFNSSAELNALSSEYLKIVTFGLPFMVIMLIVTSVFQGMGNPRTPFIITIVVNIINIILCFTTIYGFKIGIKGAAISLVIAQIVGALIGIYCITLKYKIVKIDKKFLYFNFKDVVNIYKVGLPASFESIFWQLGAMVITFAILKHGEMALSAYQIGLQVESISFMPSTALAIVSTIFVGHYIGANNTKKAKVYINEIVKSSFLLTIIGTTLLGLFPKALVSIFTNDKEVIEIAASYIRLMGIFSFFQNLPGIFNGALRAAGFTKVPMFISLIGIWVVRVPLILLFTFIFKFSILWIWYVICLDMIIKCILSFTIYKKKNIFDIKKSLVDNIT